MKEKEEEIKRFRGLLLIFSNLKYLITLYLKLINVIFRKIVTFIWVIIIYGFTSSVFRRLRKELEASQSEDHDVRRWSYCGTVVTNVTLHKFFFLVDPSIIAVCILSCMRLMSGFFLFRPLFSHPHATSLALKWLVLLWRRTSTSSVCLSCRRRWDVVRQSSKFSTKLKSSFFFFLAFLSFYLYLCHSPGTHHLSSNLQYFAFIQSNKRREVNRGEKIKCMEKVHVYMFSWNNTSYR